MGSGILGGITSSLFGSDNYHSDVAGPDAAAFQLPGMAANQQTFNAGIQSAQGRQGQAVAYDPGADQAAMNARQVQLANALQAQAAGTGGPSAAQLQMQQGLSQGLQQQLAMAASARGGQNPASMQRALMNNTANMAQQNNASTGMLRAQEQLSAQQQLGNALQQARAQDLGVSSTALQAQQANQQAALQQQSMNDQLVQFYTQAGMNQDQAQLQASMEMQRQKQATALANSQINAGVSAQNASVLGSVLGGVANGVGGALAR